MKRRRFEQAMTLTMGSDRFFLWRELEFSGTSDPLVLVAL